jgi:amidase
MTPTTITEITELSAVDISARVRARELSAVEVLNAHLAAIARHNPVLNAICTLAPEQALAAAQALDRRIARGEAVGALAGAIVGIKDVTPTAGIRTTYGSPLFADNVPAEDAEAVARLKKAGAIIVGKTNTPEFATGANTFNALFGATRNPWDTRLSASGSTGGGAAALAARMITLAEGTDHGGSMRMPAAFCGLVGLRTTPGLIPKNPGELPWHDQSVAGPMARDALDCALMLDAMTGLSARSPLSCVAPWASAFALVNAARDLSGLRVAYAPELGRIGMDEEVGRICRRAARELAACGAQVDEIEVDFSDARDAFMTLRGETMVGNHVDRLERLDEIGVNTAANIRAGLQVTVRDIAAAEKKRAEVWLRFARLFERYDVLLTPTAAVPPFPVEQNYPESINGRKLVNYMDWTAQTFLVSLPALPAASVPAGLTAAGLPVGLQIVGPRFAEPRILTVAKMVQLAHPVGAPGIVAGATG